MQTVNIDLAGTFDQPVSKFLRGSLTSCLLLLETTYVNICIGFVKYMKEEFPYVYATNFFSD